MSTGDHATPGAAGTGRPHGDARAGTLLAEAGRRPEWTHGIVNPPVYRASTCLFDTLADLDRAIADPDAGLYYARRGTPTTWALEEALTALEPGAAGTKLYASGVGAIVGALLAVLKSGDHVLMVDSVYEPTRAICRNLLKPLGIEASFYDPLVGAGVDSLFRDNTRALFLESPGSLTFEVQDLPALTAAARARGVVSIADNTWATPLRMPALALGVDISVQSLSKYVGGHSDLMLGSATATEALWPRLKNTAYRLGQCASPDDAWLALRGLRTLGARLDRHERSALAVAQWLSRHPLVERVLHPAFPGCPGHEHWRRDFSGSTGLFSFVLKHGRRSDTAALIDGLAHFGIGFSYGGYESLVLPSDPRSLRTATRWEAPGPLVRLSIGLEEPDDLVADLSRGLDRYGSVSTV